jgi:hypothetical protein
MAGKLFGTPVSWFELHFGNSSQQSRKMAMELTARRQSPLPFGFGHLRLT